jgi:hypothetical protein
MTLLVASGLLLCCCGKRTTNVGADAGSIDRGVADSAARDRGADRAASDLLPADLATDTASNTPCAQVAARIKTYAGGDMVICRSALQKVNHCNAEALCNTAGGWSLCSASQYLKRGGKAQGVQENAWLKSCVLSGGTPHAPSDALCSQCSAAKGSQVKVGWPCASQVVSYVSDFAWGAMVTLSECTRMGLDTPATEGYWIGWTTTDLLDVSVCCK